jgi:hypothetical protein
VTGRTGVVAQRLTLSTVDRPLTPTEIVAGHYHDPDGPRVPCCWCVECTPPPLVAAARWDDVTRQEGVWDDATG